MASVGPWARAAFVILLLASPIEITAQTNTSSSGNVSVSSSNASVMGKPGDEKPQPGPGVAAVSETASIIAAIGHVLILCVVAVVLGALATATYHLVRRFIVALDQRGEIGTRGRWGGFGGADTGWELTPALAVLIAALVMAVVTAALGSALVSVTAKQFERGLADTSTAAGVRTTK